MEKTKRIHVSEEELNELFMIPKGKKIKKIDEAIWDNLGESWVFDLELVDE